VEGLIPKTGEIEDAGGITFLRYAPSGFPLEMIPWEYSPKKRGTKYGFPQRFSLSAERKELAADGAKDR
jgi:hypothetical protein